MQRFSELLRKVGAAPTRVRSRDVANEAVPARGGVEVFDSPEALAINAARMAHLESLRLPLSGKRVLDVGCGVGHLAHRLQQMGCKVFCIDGRKENIAVLRERHPVMEAHVADVESQPLADFGRFDAVFAYGLIYHLENPLQALRNLASACEGLLLIETIICDHELPLVRIEDESFAVNQALAGLGCRPTPQYMVLALNRIGFPHVYTPASPPDHQDFKFKWRNGLQCWRDGHPLRCVFVASRGELKNRRLVPLVRR